MKMIEIEVCELSREARTLLLSFCVLFPVLWTAQINSIHLNCFLEAAQVSVADISECIHMKPKLFAWLDTIEGVNMFWGFRWTDPLSCSHSEDFGYAFACAQVYLKPWLVCPSHRRIGPWTTYYVMVLVYFSLSLSFSISHTNTFI